MRRMRRLVGMEMRRGMRGVEGMQRLGMRRRGRGMRGSEEMEIGCLLKKRSA